MEAVAVVVELLEAAPAQEVAPAQVAPVAVSLVEDLEDVQLAQGVLVEVGVVEAAVVAALAAAAVVVEHFVVVVHVFLAQEDLPIEEAVPEN